MVLEVLEVVLKVLEVFLEVSYIWDIIEEEEEEDFYRDP